MLLASHRRLISSRTQRQKAEQAASSAAEDQTGRQQTDTGSVLSVAGHQQKPAEADMASVSCTTEQQQQPETASDSQERKQPSGSVSTAAAEPAAQPTAACAESSIASAQTALQQPAGTDMRGDGSMLVLNKSTLAEDAASSSLSQAALRDAGKSGLGASSRSAAKQPVQPACSQPRSRSSISLAQQLPAESVPGKPASSSLSRAAQRILPPWPGAGAGPSPVSAQQADAGSTAGMLQASHAVSSQLEVASAHRQVRHRRRRDHCSSALALT